MKRYQLRAIGALCLFSGLMSSPATAVPIQYSAMLQNGLPAAGTNNQPIDDSSNPVGATYLQFFANAGSAVTVDGDRSAGHYDMAFWIFRGLYTDTDQFGPPSFDFGDPNFVAFGDDDTGPALPGPNGDPFVSFTAGTTGFYTIAVTNFLSDAGPPNPFTITATGIVPEPASTALFVLGLAGLGAARRAAVRK